MRSKLLLFTSFPTFWHLIIAAQTDKGRMELNLSKDWQKLFSQIQPHTLNGWSFMTYKRFKERIMKHHWVKLCGCWVIFVCVRYHPERNHSFLAPKYIWRQMIAPSSQRSFHRLNIITLFHRWKGIFSLIFIQLLIAVWTDLNTECELTFLFWRMLRFTSYIYIYIMLLNWAKQWESIWCWSFSSQNYRNGDKKWKITKIFWRMKRLLGAMMTHN